MTPSLLRSHFVSLALVSLGIVPLAGCGFNVDNIFDTSGGGATSGTGGGNGGQTNDAGGSPTTSTTTGPFTTASTTTTGPLTTTTMGPTCGNGTCDFNEDPVSCPADCEAQPCVHNVCGFGDPLQNGCDPCVTSVCAQDPACCTDQWDGQCIGLANQLCDSICCGNDQCVAEDCNGCPADCGMCAPPPTCGHTVCAQGEALNTTDCFDPCVEDVCAMDPWCCDKPPLQWPGECVAMAKMLCGAEPCVETVCASKPECCTTGWSADCVTEAMTACSVQCNCDHSICNEGGPLNAMCNPCADDICTFDPYCCNNNWDGICVGEVGQICGVICN